MTTTIPSTDIVASVEPLFTEPERIALAGFLAGRKGGKIVTIPLAPRTARAIDLAIGERLDGPIFLRPDGARMDRHCASRIVRRIARRPTHHHGLRPRPSFARPARHLHRRRLPRRRRPVDPNGPSGADGRAAWPGRN